jgi:hypothetical protein
MARQMHQIFRLLEPDFTDPHTEGEFLAVPVTGLEIVATTTRMLTGGAP